MKAKDVTVGSCYLAKVSGGVVPVKVLSRHEAGTGATRWTCQNINTGRQIEVKSAQRFRCECDDHGRVIMPASATATAGHPVCAGVVCRCDDESVSTCPAHGRKPTTERGTFAAKAEG